MCLVVCSAAVADAAYYLSHVSYFIRLLLTFSCHFPFAVLLLPIRLVAPIWLYCCYHLPKQCSRSTRNGCCCFLRYYYCCYFVGVLYHSVYSRADKARVVSLATVHDSHWRTLQNYRHNVANYNSRCDKRQWYNDPSRLLCRHDRPQRKGDKLVVSESTFWKLKFLCKEIFWQKKIWINKKKELARH